MYNKSMLQGEIGRNIMPVTTKEFRRIIHKYYRLSRIFIYKFIKPDKVVIYIHIYFVGKLRTDIVDEIRSYVPMGVSFVFRHIKLWEFIYGKEFGFFFRKKKRLSEKACEQERDQISKRIKAEENKGKRKHPVRQRRSKRQK